MDTEPHVTEEEMNSLTQSILTRCGIDFTCYEPKSLRRRIIRVLNHLNLSSIHELWMQFIRDKDFIYVFMNEISVGMTSMFRDPFFWKSLRSRIQTDFSNQRELSVWHAGCSTGEEVFSMGILLKEMKLQDKTKALATDFNKNALEEARKGVYHKIKMIENENNYKDINAVHDFTQYFTKDGMYDVMDPALIKHTTFLYHNLITDTFPKGFDIIFCRNVMIYFDTVTKTKLLDRFYTSLNPGGIFIIGFFDTMMLLMDNKKFSLLDEGAKIFRKQ